MFSALAAPAPSRSFGVYSPNALGEATQASGYAGGVSYHPNGAVAGHTLANGIVHTPSQNTLLVVAC